jgi:hypothetical protein
MPNLEEMHTFSECFFNADDGCLYFICHKEQGCYLFQSLRIEDRKIHPIAEFETLNEAAQAYRARITESCLELNMEEAPHKAACFRRLAYYYVKRLACRLDLNPDNINDTRRHNIYKQIDKYASVEKKLLEHSNIPYNFVLIYYKYILRYFANELSESQCPLEKAGMTDIFSLKTTNE